MKEPTLAVYKRAKLRIQTVMQRYMRWHGHLDPKVLPSKTVYSDEMHLLDVSVIIQAVVLMVIALNLSGGSVCDVDLYKLVGGYLRDPELRDRLNRETWKREKERGSWAISRP